jgi:ribosomal protein S27AE
MGRLYPWEGLNSREMVGRKVVAVENGKLVLSGLTRLVDQKHCLAVAVKEVTLLERTCPECGTVFVPPRMPKKVYCSRPCIRKAETKRRVESGYNKRAYRKRKREVAKRAQRLTTLGLSGSDDRPPPRKRVTNRLV